MHSSSRYVLIAQEHYVHIDAKTHVVGEIPSGVIRIVINDDVVGIPEPSVAVLNVIGRDIEIESAEPEASGSAATQPPHMAGTDRCREMPVFPGMIEAIILVVAARVSDPAAGVRIYVRSCRVTGAIRLSSRWKRSVFARTV